MDMYILKCLSQAPLLSCWLLVALLLPPGKILHTTPIMHNAEIEKIDLQSSKQ